MNPLSLLTKPLHGGAFGHDEYELGSMPCIAMGLHAVRYLVIQRRAGIVVSASEDKHQALADARRVIVSSGHMAAANDGRPPLQGQLWSDDELPPWDAPAPAPIVSRRRREIFNRSAGRCWYCGCELQLAGEWEAEHQRPRALGGGDSALNLVAACIPCNRRKSDRTALEFIAGAP